MATVQKTDIIKQVANETGNSIKDCETIVNNFLDTVKVSLKKNEKVSFIGFGTFNAKNVPATKGRNPQTGQEITIPARRKVTFSVGKGLKDAVN